MLSLSNSTLSIALLDPRDTADRVHQGVRYCWGGYIWQVTDSAAGPLFTGPQWPESNPTPFNGQGLPESFRHHEFGTGRALMLEDQRGLVIGIGEVAPDAKGELAVAHPCDWAITPSPGTLEFCAAQSWRGYACQVTRRVSLVQRTIISATSLTNTGTRALPLHWFAHPFFELNDRTLTCRIPATWSMAENAGYALDGENRITFKRRFENVDDGHFEPLIVGKNTPLRAIVSHPRVKEIGFSTDFVPDFCPVWANSNTWSIEPYIATTLEPGASRAWTLRYEIGR